jgi:hypothetical protein
MIRRLLALLALLLPAACAGTRERETPEAGPSEVFLYRASVASVPAGASSVVLRVRIPVQGLRALQAYGLVGNAPFECSLAGDPGPLSPAGAREHAELTCRDCEEGGVRFRELLIETRGKPLELTLRLARPRAAASEASALEQELASATSATADGRPIAALATRLERGR